MSEFTGWPHLFVSSPTPLLFPLAVVPSVFFFPLTSGQDQACVLKRRLPVAKTYHQIYSSHFITQF